MEIKTYTPPEGTYGPVWAEDIPEGWRWLAASFNPSDDDGRWGRTVMNGLHPEPGRLFWVKPPPISVGDRYKDATGDYYTVRATHQGQLWVEYDNPAYGMGTMSITSQLDRGHRKID